MPDIFSGLRIATESLSDTIYRKASQTNFWTGWVDNDEFPRNRGTVQTTFTVGNSEPITNTEDWLQVTQGDPVSTSAVTNVCAPAYTNVTVGYTSKTYNPKRFGLAGPVVCRETLAFAHDPAMFLRQYQNELVKRAKRTWEFELRNQATLLSSKVVCDATFAIQAPAATFDANAATSQLSLPMLDVIAQYLIEIGATDADQDWVELGPDGPVFNLVIGNEAAARILTNTATIRTDWQYAQMGMGPKADLLKRIGANRMVRNFRVVPTVLPPRYNFASGVYTQVPTYVMTAGVASINPNYQSALYEVAFVPHPMAFKKSIIRPDSAGLDWSPLNYMGEWKWITGPEMSSTFNFDPMRNYGRHFAEFMYAPKPVFPEFGVAIMYLRCPTTYPAVVNCTAL